MIHKYNITSDVGPATVEFDTVSAMVTVTTNDPKYNLKLTFNTLEQLAQQLDDIKFADNMQLPPSTSL